MISEEGSIKFCEANDANIPVVVALNQRDEDGKWVLSASNYMPRKDQVRPDEYEAVAETREELVGHVKQYIIPLYKTALRILEEICEGKNDMLYYWK